MFRITEKNPKGKECILCLLFRIKTEQILMHS